MNATRAPPARAKTLAGRASQRPAVGVPCSRLYTNTGGRERLRRWVPQVGNGNTKPTPLPHASGSPRTRQTPPPGTNTPIPQETPAIGKHNPPGQTRPAQLTLCPGRHHTTADTSAAQTSYPTAPANAPPTAAKSPSKDGNAKRGETTTTLNGKPTAQSCSHVNPGAVHAGSLPPT
jgi:hypothetical protein